MVLISENIKTQHKKGSFWWKISSVNVTEFGENRGVGHVTEKNP